MNIKASIIDQDSEVRFDQELSDIINSNQTAFYHVGYKVFFNGILECVDLIDTLDGDINMVFMPL